MYEPEERYNSRKLSTIIWHFLTPTIRVALTAILALVYLCISVKDHIVYQFMLCMMIFLVFIFNSELWKYHIKRIHYILIHILCALGIIVLIISGVYTERHLGSFDSVTALYAYNRITSGKTEISLAGSTEDGTVFLAKKDLDEADIISYFGKLENCELYLESVDYYGKHYLYSGSRLIAYYKSTAESGFQIIKYYRQCYVQAAHFIKNSIHLG